MKLLIIAVFKVQAISLSCSEKKWEYLRKNIENKKEIIDVFKIAICDDEQTGGGQCEPEPDVIAEKINENLMINFLLFILIFL